MALNSQNPSEEQILQHITFDYIAFNRTVEGFPQYILLTLWDDGYCYHVGYCRDSICYPVGFSLVTLTSHLFPT